MVPTRCCMRGFVAERLYIIRASTFARLGQQSTPAMDNWVALGQSGSFCRCGCRSWHAAHALQAAAAARMRLKTSGKAEAESTVQSPGAANLIDPSADIRQQKVSSVCRLRFASFRCVPAAPGGAQPCCVSQSRRQLIGTQLELKKCFLEGHFQRLKMQERRGI